MKIAAVFRNRGVVKSFVRLCGALRERGHEVLVVTQQRDPKVATLLADVDVDVAFLPPDRRDELRSAVELVRRGRDYLQYLQPEYAHATKLRARAFARLARELDLSDLPAGAADAGQRLGPASAANLSRLLTLAESAVPTDRGHDQFLRKHRPDAILVSPLIHFGSAQTEIVSSAQRAGIPVAMLLFSWDNMSTKGALHAMPDQLFVWNERQRREAVELHGIPEKRIHVTGAPRFDDFFERRSLVERGDFCEQLGLRPEAPIITYLCSSRLIARQEVRFIRRWLEAVRARPSLRQASVIIRPHPDQPLKEGRWRSEVVRSRWRGLSGAELWRQRLNDDEAAITLISDDLSQQVLLECIHHSRAVVGLNTSAEIEAGIVGRPVLTVLADDASSAGQSGTLHFDYLLEENGGFVRLARELDEHALQLAHVLEGPAPADAPLPGVLRFVRPVAADRPASEVVADAVERLLGGDGSAPAARRAAPLPDPWLQDAPPRDEPPRSARGTDLTPGEEGALARLAELAAPGDVLYDLTAGTGEFAVEAARRFGCAVIAFEANLPAIHSLWSAVRRARCDGLVVPVPMRPGAKTRLERESYSAVEGPRGERLRGLWREHGTSPGSDIVQPLLTAPLAWAIQRWKLPAPNFLRVCVSAKEDDLGKAVATALPEERLRFVAAQGDELPESLRSALGSGGFELVGEQGEGEHVVRWFERAGS